VHNGSYLAYLDAVTDHEGACATLRESIEYAHAPNYSWDEVDARFLLAKLLQQQEEIEDAKVEFERCRELSQSVGLRLMDDDCRRALAELAQHEPEEPESVEPEPEPESVEPESIEPEPESIEPEPESVEPEPESVDPKE
jgi:outer membrane biosynthesis protein TonB